MASQIGLVTRISSTGFTEVLTERQSACGGCSTTHGCKTCLTTNKIKAQVHNPIGASPGDLVEIHLAQSAVARSAAILYGLPLLGLLIGAILGAGTGGAWFANPSTGSVLFGLAGLLLGLVLAVAVGNSTFAKTQLVPTIVRVVEAHAPTPAHRGA